MKLQGTETWSDEEVDSALAFSGNLRNATISIILKTIEQNLPGGPIALSAWAPTDLIYQLGDAAGLAFATGRLSDGLRIAALVSGIGGNPPAYTLMQIIFGATLGAIAGTTRVWMLEDEFTIEFHEPRGIVKIDLGDYSLAEQQRLAGLLIPAAFASPTFLDKIHGPAIGGFEKRYQTSPLDLFARLSTLVRVVRDHQRTRRIDQTLLMGSLLDYEGYIATLQDDADNWNELALRSPLIDWPLLATLVGIHRWTDTEPEHDLTVGPATRFLHDLAREIVSSRSPTLETGDSA